MMAGVVGEPGLDKAAFIEDARRSTVPEAENLKAYIRTIPDWPKPGIQFRDITTVIKDPNGFRLALSALLERYQQKQIEVVVGIEARGFIFGAALANNLGLGFVPVRKKGKLPGEVAAKSYALEYGEDSVEIHKDSIGEGVRALVVDDLVATGGTALAACELVKELGGVVVEAAFVIDLPDLGGAERLRAAGISVFSLVDFEGE
jgi:adenine phosphoribosyltransferase